MCGGVFMVGEDRLIRMTLPVSKSQLPEKEIQIPVRGGTLSVHQYGKESNRPILAIHGVTSSNRAWQCLAGSLVPHGFTIYGVDLRGRGNSNNLPGPFGMKTHAEDMVAVIDFLKLEKIDVIGHSMGGFVTIALLGMFPTRVGQATLIDGGIPLAMPPGFTVEQILSIVLGPALERLSMTFPSKEAYRDYWKPQSAFAKGWNEVWDEYVDFDLKGIAPNLKPATNSKAVEEDSRDLFGDNLISDTLKNLNREVKFLRAVRGLQNEEIPLYPSVVLDQVLPTYPKIKVVTIEDTNHYDILIHQDGADKCAKEIYGVN
jgi:lipase